MGKYFVILSLIFAQFLVFGQNTETKNLYYGNSFYNAEKYDDAISYYEKVLEQNPLHFKALFNIANAYFRKNDFEKAAEYYDVILDLSPSDLDKAKSFHNLGNAYFMQMKLDEAIEAYTSALRINSLDEGTRYNLAYALLLKEQKEQNQQNQKQENQNNNENKQENNENQNQQDQSDNEQNQNKEDQNKEDQNKSTDGGENGDEEKQQPLSPSNKISKEQAKRILEAAAKREKEIMKMVEKNKNKSSGVSSEKDW